MVCERNDGDVSWVLFSTVLVCGMLPGLAFFEAGFLRTKNTLSVIVQVISGFSIMSVMWIVVGFSLTFSKDHGGLIGDFDHCLFIGIDYDGCYNCSAYTEPIKIPQATFAIFQMMFAVITPLLMTGAFAERIAYKAFLILTIAWEVIVYYPLAHWIWGNGWLDTLGVLDFAGGIVIHASTGASALVACWALGPRVGFGHGEFPASSLPLAAIGATFLWIGWFGFNAGSSLMAGPSSIHAVVNSQVAATTSATVWLILSVITTGMPSLTCLLNGAIAGFAGITPAAGYVSSPSAICIALVVGCCSFFAIPIIRDKLKIDDALDVSSVHGVSGIVGSLAIGIAASKNVNSGGDDGMIFAYGSPRLLGLQLLGVVIAVVYASVCTFLIITVLKRWTSLRATTTQELKGLDIAVHQETAYRMALIPPDHTKEGSEASGTTVF